MPAAILFRGHAFRPPGQTRPWGVDWRLCVESHRRHLIEPLKERYGDLAVFLSTYHSAHDAAVERDYGPVGVVWCSEPGTQKGCVVGGLTAVVNDAERLALMGFRYDLVAVCRFDIELKGDPTAHPGFAEGKINLLWREWKEECWIDHSRCCDTIHFIPGRLLDGFMRGVQETPSEGCLHLIYRPVQKWVGTDQMNVILGDEIHDSNTDADPHNPFYRMIRVY